MNTQTFLKKKYVDGINYWSWALTTSAKKEEKEKEEEVSGGPGEGGPEEVKQENQSIRDTKNDFTWRNAPLASVAQLTNQWPSVLSVLSS